MSRLEKGTTREPLRDGDPDPNVHRHPLPQTEGEKEGGVDGRVSEYPGSHTVLTLRPTAVGRFE